MMLQLKLIEMFKSCAAIAFAGMLAACGGGESSKSESESAAASNASSLQSNASEKSDQNAEGPEYYVETIPSPCSMITEAVAQNIMNVREVQAAPSNSGPESLNPRCSYRDGEQKSKGVSIVVVRTPYSAINSTMSSAELRKLVEQNYGDPGTPYRAVDLGPGEHRFVAEKDDSVTMFVMSGVGVFGGTYDYKTISAEAAFAVTLRDPERTAEERLTQARNIAVEYNSALISAAQKR